MNEELPLLPVNSGIYHLVSAAPLRSAGLYSLVWLVVNGFAVYNFTFF